MDYTYQLLTLAGVMLVACISPGPDFIAVTAQSLSNRRSGLATALGVATGCLVWATLAVFGLGVILSKLVWLYDVIRYFGAAYLIYLGVMTFLSLRKKTSEISLHKEHSLSFLQAYRRGLLVNLTNPKSVAFFGSLFVTVIPAHAPVWVYGATLIIVSIVAACWFCTLATLFSNGHVRSTYLKLRKPFDAAMGGVLVALGTKLAIDH
ncbi:LysE family transporter [Microvirga sp. W0021]|uniref:LysE family transporter n=1 Tax=Hohaiivirga grylli TaxID=3133970 RepID=A0ABV0BKQ3_9HYPH